MHAGQCYQKAPLTAWMVLHVAVAVAVAVADCKATIDNSQYIKNYFSDPHLQLMSDMMYNYDK